MRIFYTVLTAFLLFSGSLYSQSEGRTASVEMTMSPFEESEAFMTPYYFKGRYFISGFAARLGLGTNMMFSSDQNDDAGSVKNLAQFEIRPGVEYHIAASAQAIPYVGIDFVYALQNRNLNTEVGAPIDGAWDLSDFEGTRGYYALGFNIVAGGDYYIKGGNFYVGTEIGFEFLSISYKEVTWNEQVVAEKTKRNQFKPVLNSTIRVGIAF